MRIRSIKPEFWRSTAISSLEIEDRLLFIGLWSYVDDNGVGIDKLSSIAADLFADDLERDPHETFARVSRGLARLSAAGRIARYTVEGDDFLCVTGWSEHQRIDRPGKPRYPHVSADSAVIREGVASPRESVATGTGEQGNRGTGEQGIDIPPSGGKKKKPATPLPDDWTPSDACVRFAAENGIDLEHQVTQFRLHVAANDRRQADWHAAFRMWLGNAKQWEKPQPKSQGTRADENAALFYELYGSGGERTGGVPALDVGVSEG